MSERIEVPQARKAFGKRLASFRRQRGWLQKELAARLDVKPTMIAQYETGRVFPSVPVLMRMAEVLQVVLDRLLFEHYEQRDEIEDKELVTYLIKTDSLDRRERALIKDFIDSVLARAELHEMKRVAQKKNEAA